ncbi:hypothetical protein GIB67_014924 [Kingdonia uniflora]|uniref:EF-hand domain-containing protein n=1 Tax=Kingdonia uniflora TaxID=39325 RepID=A0A7J7MTM2_9MAGN|nr:hypothetical protein GIB67_014924 [Kingdonia uniflora]
MLDADPKRRLTAQQVLDHPWLQCVKKAPNVSLGETVVAEHLSVEEVAGIKESFQLMDANNNGKITLGELKVGLDKIGHNVPDTDLQMLMEVADVDENGTLDFREYVAVTIHLRKIGNDEYLHIAFTFFDKNKSGYIEIEELRDALADEVDTNNEEVITAIIHDVDTDKDGKISYEEFATVMKARTDWRKHQDNIQERDSIISV